MGKDLSELSLDDLLIAENDLLIVETDLLIASYPLACLSLGSSILDVHMFRLRMHRTSL